MKFKDIKDKRTGELLYGDWTGKQLKTSSGIVDMDYETTGVKMTSLEGAPKKCHRLYAMNNELVDLKYSPEECTSMSVDNNPTLVSLEGAPTDISTYFSCKENPNLKNPMEQIYKYRIRAKTYETDEGYFNFADVEDMFENYFKYKSIKSKGFKSLLGLK